MSRKKRRSQRRPPARARPPSRAAQSDVAVLPAAKSQPHRSAAPDGAVVPTSQTGARREPQNGREVADRQLEVLVGLVATGALDDCLGLLQAVIAQRQRDRRHDAAQQAAARLQVGDRVVVSHAIRPQYLRGATGTVTGWSGGSAVVQLDTPVGRYATGEVRCPPLGLHPLTE